MADTKETAAARTTVARNGRLRRASPHGAAAARNELVEQRFLRLCGVAEEELFAELETSAKGLSEALAEERLDAYGPNSLAGGPRYGFLKDIWLRVRNPLVVQLVIICALSFALGDPRSGSVVGGMLFLSVVFSYIQESRSGRAVEKLRKLVRTSVLVAREGRETEIDIGLVVPGDVVVLAAGDIIPADVRILQAKDFFVSQSVLTGESLPVEKTARILADAKEALELSNACFQGSNVVSGSARALVVGTGMQTYLGMLSKTLGGAPRPTSFDRGVKSFVWLMVRFMVVMVSAVFLIVGVTKHDWFDALLFGLSIAVGLTPEMLPMILTVCLSKGALVMSRKKVIVKQLNAIQNFGAMNIICSDKTGTLTQDRVVLERHVDVVNRESEDVLRYAYMNSYYQTGLRNLLDKAVLANEDLDVERTCRKVDELPFDFQRKRMSVVIEYEGTHVLICKGAVEDVYGVCDRYQIDEEIYPLTEVIKTDLSDDYRELSEDGYRVLAIAYREFGLEKETFAAGDETNLILLGYIAFFDPPKDSALQAIESLNRCGVAVKILTGDNELVTLKVCKDVGLAAGKVLLGKQIAGMSDEEFLGQVEETDVFARLTPSQKERIVTLLKKKGNVVGFMGDGINDAPAMRAADVGISVDTATDIAKESAGIILLEKSLLVLQDGIIEGRRIFANITKYIKMGASSNFGNMFSMLGASLFLPFLPMAPIQVLLNNFLYDISQLGIPTDRVDDEFLAKPKKWNIDLIKKFMIFIGPLSSIFDYATFFLMLFFFRVNQYVLAATPAATKTYLASLFHTGWFVESILTQTLIVHIIRTNRIPFIQSGPGRALAFSTLSVVAVGILLPYSLAGPALGLVPLPAVFWLWLAIFLLAYSALTHSVKLWFFRRYGN